ncbi:MAG: DUF1549 domain-containing protein [Candidatus Solibacter usitatus]|nr:DUF1549 domain-containing protein [Candidatus Solibacter usitatus]
MRLCKLFLTAAAIAGLASVCAGQEKTVSIGDCRFANDPAEFLNKSALIRGRIDANTRKLDLRGARAVAADTIPRRNFIDDEILGKLTRKGVKSAPLSTDEEFFRRIYLDLTGRIPAPADIRAFLADSSVDKRDAVIDKLLNSAEFTDRWTMWMGDLLQNTSTLINAAANRNADGRNAFHSYIRDAVSHNRPFTAIAREVIAGKGNNYDAAAGAANFPMGASTAMGPMQDTYDTMLVRTVTTFLGLGNYDCLLCHDGRRHLNQVNVWGTAQTRWDAQSMAAFFSRMALTASNPRGSFMVSDMSDGWYDLNTNSGNRPERKPVAGMAVVSPVYRETGATPRDGDWRGAFADNLVRDPMFARNLANRLWKQMFGLAVADPVDALDPARLDPANPPEEPWEFQATHPELLDKLAAELAKQNFQLREFLKTLVQSSAYQLSSRYDGEWSSDYVPLFARHFARRMEGEEVHDAVAAATGAPGSYTVAGFPSRVEWAMQLPEPVEPASDATARNFMNTFLRGDRDTQERSQAGSIQQSLYLMNDSFVSTRVKTARSPKLAAMAQMTDAAMVEEAYLTFLSRMPTEAERATAMTFLAKTADRRAAAEDLAWMCINKIEFLFSY